MFDIITNLNTLIDSSDPVVKTLIAMFVGVIIAFVFLVLVNVFEWLPEHLHERRVLRENYAHEKTFGS